MRRLDGPELMVSGRVGDPALRLAHPARPKALRLRFQDGAPRGSVGGLAITLGRPAGQELWLLRS
jgi:hypothetical protein